MTDTLTYLRAYKDQDLFTLPICKSVSDLFHVQYKWQKNPFIPLHYLNPICIERQINYLWQGKGRGVYKKNLKNIYCTGTLDVKDDFCCLGFFPNFFFFLWSHNTPQTTWVSASYSWPKDNFSTRGLNTSTVTRLCWKPIWGVGVVNENVKHISAYNVQRLDLHNCTQFATCTARDENEIKTSWEWLSWEDTITIKNLNIKYKYRATEHC